MMADFKENFPGVGGPLVCPLCLNHLDNQALSLQCEVIKRQIKSNGNINEVFNEEVKEETADLIKEIMKIRAEVVK